MLPVFPLLGLTSLYYLLPVYSHDLSLLDNNAYMSVLLHVSYNMLLHLLCYYFTSPMKMKAVQLHHYLPSALLVRLLYCWFDYYTSDLTFTLVVGLLHWWSDYLHYCFDYYTVTLPIVLLVWILHCWSITVGLNITLLFWHLHWRVDCCS